MSVTKQNVVDLIQWVLIVVLSAILLLGYLRDNKQFINNEEYSKENTYVRIYESQKIEKLKNENKQLYDSIKKLSNVESAIKIRYKYRFKTDTVFVEKENNIKQVCDSLYNFQCDNDTVNYNLKIKAKNLQWYKMNFVLNDNFTIINQNKDDINKITVYKGENVTIEETSVFHNKKNKWYDKFAIGPTVGIGINKDGNINTYFGVGITFDLK